MQASHIGVSGGILAIPLILIQLSLMFLRRQQKMAQALRSLPSMRKMRMKLPAPVFSPAQIRLLWPRNGGSLSLSNEYISLPKKNRKFTFSPNKIILCSKEKYEGPQNFVLGAKKKKKIEIHAWIFHNMYFP